MANLGIGSIIKFAVNVDGIGEKYVSDNDVDLTCDFYIQDNYSAGVVTVEKSDMVPGEEGDTNIYFAAVDTSILSEGKLMCATSISYTDSDLQTEIVEKVQTQTGVNLIDIK